MDYTFSERLKNAWNAFRDQSPSFSYKDIGVSSSTMPGSRRSSFGNDKSIVNAIYNRMAIDVSSVSIHHSRVDENDNYLSTINSTLERILTLDANMDQTGRDLIQDIAMSMFDEGVVAVVPVDTNINPRNKESFEILSLRVGSIIEWYPAHVKVRLYDERRGQKEDILIPKRTCAIIRNPFYSVMNERNSVARRLIHKLNILDAIDEQSGAGKLDLIIQLPYVVRNEARKAQAEERKRDLEMQLANSKYGVAYTDVTEHITQLNRSVDNNLMKQVEYLTASLYGQLGLTEEIMNGSANSEVMTNYYNRTIEPILSAIVDEMKRKFLSRNARTRGESIKFIRDPFKLASVTQIATVADTFTRNEILTSNEVRALIGFKPSSDPKADELRNKNLNEQMPTYPEEGYDDYTDEQGYYDENEEPVPQENY